MRFAGSLLLLLLVVACKGGGGGDSVTSGSAIMNGVYQTCKYVSEDDYSMRSTVYVNDEMLSEVTRYYSSSGCLDANVLFEDRSIYRYAKNGSKYRLSYVGMSSTSLSSDDIDYNNTNSYCGYSDFVINIPKVTLGRNCDGSTVGTGDYMDVTLSKSGSNFTVVAPGGTFHYASINGWNFTNQGQTVSNGSWYYFDGAAGAILSTNNGAYTMSYFDPQTSRYFTATGTYTSSNNSVQTTVTSYSPDCGDDEGSTYTEKFVQTAFSLSIQGETENEGTVFEKIDLTPTQIRNALFGSFSTGCF
jgi:hypothetical protein